MSAPHYRNPRRPPPLDPPLRKPLLREELPPLKPLRLERFEVPKLLRDERPLLMPRLPLGLLCDERPLPVADEPVNDRPPEFKAVTMLCPILFSPLIKPSPIWFNDRPGD